MMSFCKKTVHSFLSLSLSQSTITTTEESPSHHHCRLIPSTSGCFCLIAEDTQKPPNVLGSAAIKPTSSTPTPTTTTSCNKDSNTFGLLDNVGNGILKGSCTESLGFESSDYPMEESLEVELWKSRSTAARSRWKTTVAKARRRQETNFPPPLPSLNQNGQPSFYLKSMRRNGRLELTEVKIQRPPEILRASRQDGRLRLQLIKSEEPQQPLPLPDQEGDQLEEQERLPLPHVHREEEVEEITEEADEISDEEEEEEEEERRLSNPWKLDGIRWRCHELDNHRQHHLLLGAAIV